MFSKASVSILLTVLCLASAHPAKLQQQYGSQSTGSVHSSHDDHPGSHDSHDDHSAGQNLGDFAGSNIDFAALPENSLRSQPGSAASSNSNTQGNSYLPPKRHYADVPIELAKGLESPPSGEVTVTEVVTSDVFKTETNLFYNTIPVTLTEFMRTTIVQPTLEVVRTPVPDRVSIQKSPNTITQTVTVTDTLTSYQYPTAVSTDVYTVTHKAYDIQQQLITSTVIEKGFFRPTIVNTKVLSEYLTSTVFQTVTNTVLLNAPKNSYLAPEIGSQSSQFSNVIGQRAVLASNQAELKFMIDSISRNDVATLRNSQAQNIAREMSRAETAPSHSQFGLNQQLLNQQQSLMTLVRSDLENQGRGQNFDQYIFGRNS